MHANRHGRAFASTRHRHVHVSDQPFVIVGYHLPGDPSAPIGVMYGDHPERPRLAFSLNPTNWRTKVDSMQRFALALNRYIATASRRGNDAPQLLLANQAAVDWLCGDIGRHWRTRETEGPWAVPQEIPIAGAHLSYFASASGIPGSSAVLPLADVLADHWATGRLATLDRRLGVMLAWIRRPGDIAEAEAELSDGPVPDADWEKKDYLVALRAYQHRSADPSAAGKLIETTVQAALEPTWDYAWQAHKLLHDMSEAETVPERWERDRARFTHHADRIRNGRAQFRSILPLLDAYIHIDRVERMNADLANAMAFDDEIIMAAHVAHGVALSGVVIDNSARILTIRPDLPFERAAGTNLWWRTRAMVNGHAKLVYVGLRIRSSLDDELVELDVVSGAAAASVRDRLPAVGSRIVCAPFGGPEFMHKAYPKQLPWTHLPAEDPT